MILNQVINTFVCPSDDKDNPVYLQALDSGNTTITPTFPVPSPTGVNGGSLASSQMNGLFGALDYILCSGVSDAFCDSGAQVPGWERGMFMFNMNNPAQGITDGLSNTFMMGEGAQGSKWLVTNVRNGSPSSTSRERPSRRSGPGSSASRMSTLFNSQPRSPSIRAARSAARSCP